jgi:cytochrome c-type biogenesis protein CcmE
LFKNKKVIIGAVIVLAAIVFLSIRAFAGSATYYYELAELNQKSQSLYGETVKVRGLVEEGSVQQVTESATLRFIMTDESRNFTLPVVYKGAVPDTFKEGSEVVCEGILGVDNIFQARVLMPKCPSKYSPVVK